MTAPIPFADRTQWELAPNRLAQRIESLRREGISFLDLTSSNPTQCGIEYPPDLLESLTNPQSLFYEPSPKGLRAARHTIAQRYSEKRVQVSPEQIFLTASTSEAYGFLFRLLCDPGDQVLIPKPSYPLFEYLADLHDVVPISYSLSYRGRWRINLQEISKQINSKTRAIVVVHPNNPTGSCITTEEWDSLKQLCQSRQIPIISDEVFSDYRCENPAESIPVTLAGNTTSLTFALGGLSKSLGLPQMKLSWCVCSGPSEIVSDATERLEVISDTFLSVNTPVQHALSFWFQKASAVRSQIQDRICSNRHFLEEQTQAVEGCRSLLVDGGWSAVLKIPFILDEEDFIVRLLEEDRVLIHPGYFFNFDEPGYLVVSLLVAPKIFQEGILRLMRKWKK